MNKLIVLALFLFSCGTPYRELPPKSPPTTIKEESIPPSNDDPYFSDDFIVRSSATITISSDQTFATCLFNFLIPSVYAATGTTSIVYINSPGVTFTINTTNFVPGGWNGDILSLGSIAISSLSDNHLKICGGGGNQKCTLAVIRVYTTGSIEGFVNTDDGTYGTPVYAGSLNPNSPVGLTSSNAVQVQTFTIPANRNKIRLSDFPSPTYDVSSDFYNGGSGNYSMTFVVEYALQ